MNWITSLTGFGSKTTCKTGCPPTRQRTPKASSPRPFSFQEALQPTLIIILLVACCFPRPVTVPDEHVVALVVAHVAQRCVASLMFGDRGTSGKHQLVGTGVHIHGLALLNKFSSLLQSQSRAPGACVPSPRLAWTAVCITLVHRSRVEPSPRSEAKHIKLRKWFCTSELRTARSELRCLQWQW